MFSSLYILPTNAYRYSKIDLTPLTVRKFDELKFPLVKFCPTGRITNSLECIQKENAILLIKKRKRFPNNDQFSFQSANAYCAFTVICSEKSH